MFYIISVGHLIISNKSHGKNITTYISNSLNIEYYFQKIRDFTDQNVLLVKKIDTFWSVKSIIFILCIRDVRHFKAVVLQFLKCTITFL